VKKMTYRILSFDGGGVRGAYTATLLARVAECTPLIANADLLAGTSTGGIIALALAAGYSPGAIVNFYRNSARKIFDRSFSRDLADLHGLTGADYSNANLKEILTADFGDQELSQLGKRVIIPSFHLDDHDADAAARSCRPKFFHNFPGPHSDGNQKVVDVAMRTSAAPTYFPTYGEYVDGGVVANDPSMAAVCQALKFFQQPGMCRSSSVGPLSCASATQSADSGGTSYAGALKDIRLFSIGTGRNAVFIAGVDHDWGLAEWARPLVSMMIDGVMGVAEFQCRNILGDAYFRLEPLLPRPVAIDDASVVGDLIEYANAVDIREAVEWLGRNWA
jgi:uncharacterized protein